MNTTHKSANPFPGLRAFTQEERARFRHSLIQLPQQWAT